MLHGRLLYHKMNVKYLLLSAIIILGIIWLYMVIYSAQRAKDAESKQIVVELFATPLIFYCLYVAVLMFAIFIPVNAVPALFVITGLLFISYEVKLACTAWQHDQPEIIYGIIAIILAIICSGIFISSIFGPV